MSKLSALSVAILFAKVTNLVHYRVAFAALSRLSKPEILELIDVVIDARLRCEIMTSKPLPTVGVA